MMCPMGNWVEGLVLGAVQGFTEWMPISSKGVVTLIQLQFFGADLNSALSLALWLHLGTLLAAILYFRKELFYYITKVPLWLFKRKALAAHDRAMLDFLFITTLVTGLVGVPLLRMSLDLKLDGEVVMGLIGLLLIGTGLFQFFTKVHGSRTERDVQWHDGLFAGLFQGFAALPGFSRSGLTVTTLLLRGFREVDAIRISFFMSIPAVFGSQILLKILEETGEIAPPEPTMAVVGLLASGVVGWLTMAGLIKLVRKLPFWAVAIGLGLISLMTLLI